MFVSHDFQDQLKRLSFLFFFHNHPAPWSRHHQLHKKLVRYTIYMCCPSNSADTNDKITH